MTRKIYLLFFIPLLVVTACTATGLPVDELTRDASNMQQEAALGEAPLRQEPLGQGPALQEGEAAEGPAGGETSLKAAEAQQDSVGDVGVAQEGAVESVELAQDGEVTTIAGDQVGPSVVPEDREQMLSGVNRGGPPLPIGEGAIEGPQPGTGTAGGGGTVPVLPSSPTGKILIRTVEYAGSGDQELGGYVEIQSANAVNIQLQGWSLNSDFERLFTFADHVIRPGEVCRVYSDGVHPEWCGFVGENGETLRPIRQGCVYLNDMAGVRIDEYCGS